VSSAYTLELSGAGDLDHGHTGPYVDQQVRVNVRSGLGKLHWFGIGIAVSKDFIGDFGDEKVETWLSKENPRLEKLPLKLSISGRPSTYR
jgi:hypothetical protein